MSSRTQKKTTVATARKNSLRLIQDDFYESFISESAPTAQDYSSDQLRHIVAHHKELSLARKKNKTVIEVFNPESTSGWTETGHTIINIVAEDQAFIIDSVIAHLSRKAMQIERILHPLIYIGEDKKSIIYSSRKSEGARGESHIFIQLNRRLTKEHIAELKASLQIVCEDTTLANRDWQATKKAVSQLRENLVNANPKNVKQFEDFLDFIDYVHNDNFTLLGMCDYNLASGKLKQVAGSGLGLLSEDRSSEFLNEIDRTDILQNPDLFDLPQVYVTKLTKRSKVHRCVPVDAILVRRVDANQKTKGVTLIIGLFTSVTYSRSLSTVPFLRLKAENVMTRAGFEGPGHGGRAMRHILEKYPRDDLFQIEPENLYQTRMNILQLQEQPRIALYIRPDFFGRTVTCMVYIPRDVFDSRLRMHFAEILSEELNATYQDFQSAVDDSPMVRSSFVLSWNKDASKEFDVKKIEKRLQEAGTSWAMRLNAALAQYDYTEDEAAAVTHKYGRAFPDSYQEKYQVRQSVHDIEKIEHVLAHNVVDVDFYRPFNAESGEVSLKIFSLGNPVMLSDVLPVLENMGLKIIAEYPFEVRVEGAAKSVWIQDFQARVVTTRQDELSLKKGDIQHIQEEFETCLKAVWAHQVENDSLNRLILLAGMPWRDVIILRSYVRYLRQTKIPFSLPYMERALTDHPDIARALTQYFAAYFDPAAQAKKSLKPEAIKQEILEKLQGVTLLDQDRVLRAMLSLISCTLRTNFYQLDKHGHMRPAVAMKFDSSQIADIPDPKPYREIFIYSPRVEGIHLRGGPIARGGLRWSDRHEDFRTEVLGLMKAQQVKNSVIVPMGAKGGFVVKMPPAEGGRDAYQKEGVACYQTYIGALLDITDNRKSGKVVPPANVIRRDQDDPYLVVAADKGTATFSDIANAISVERGFWLGDAFASGGSAGYDHKKMGITARGAWESVKRHFRELNHNTQTQPFDVVGVGDMGGDVFGNGLLQSDKIQLVGAFNHVHIFCDPNPDGASSFKERERLFKAVKGWDQYDTSKLSKGGRIYLRSEKALKLTPEIQQRFDIAKDTVSPSELMQAMLRARTDLLFFGGIGTYIKATQETDADVGDRSNDAQRINATEVRAKVVGEGANLGVTQRGRIEYAMRGGRINTDFIDNSAGVDTSDHEVNIKILMADLMSDAKQKMTVAGRDKILASMTDDVARLVLNDNYQQTQAISLLESQAADLLPEHAAFMLSLEKAGLLNRRVEFLPDAEQIEQRFKLRKGLTRPELSLIVSYGKLTYTNALLQTKLPDDPKMRDWLMRYFPENLQKKYAAAIEKHQLRRNIIAMSVSNAVVNRMGPTFVRMAQEKTGRSLEDITGAYLLVRDAFDLRPLWEQIEALDNKIPAQVQLRAIQKIGKLAERATYWLLNADLNLDVQSDYRGSVQQLKACLEKCLPDEQRENFLARRKMWMENGLPQKLAHEIALLPLMASAFDILRLANNLRKDIVSVTQIYFAVGDYFQFERLRGKVQNLPQDTPQMVTAVESLLNSFYVTQSAFTACVIKETVQKKNATNILSAIEKAMPQAGGIMQRLQEQERQVSLDFPALVVLEQQLRRMI